MRGKKGRNYISRQALRPFFPLIIFILLCFNVLSTVPRENRPADFLYIYIYIYSLWFSLEFMGITEIQGMKRWQRKRKMFFALKQSCLPYHRLEKKKRYTNNWAL